MTIERWSPPSAPSAKEERILKRLKRNRKLFAFLRTHRLEILDQAFQEKLAAMYRDTGAGSQATAPGLMCMALLLQSYSMASDAEAVELTVMDARWKLVLDRLGQDDPAFSQGALHRFRERLIEHDMDRELLERTVEVARKTKDFDWKKLPKKLHVGMDSRPLRGAGRVEDTFNLLGHAARKIAECAADLSGLTFEQVCRRGGARVLLASSVKAGLDVNWSDPEQKEEALERLVAQVGGLANWVNRLFAGEALEGPITRYIRALEQIQDQDLEESEEGRPQIRQGVAKDRRISIEEQEMRHGRKSKSHRFNGYKEHIAAELDEGIILACDVTPANTPEEEAGQPMKEDIERQGFRIAQLSIDRGYLNSPIVGQVEDSGGEVTCKPWPLRNNKGLFSKRDFDINLRDKTVTCPAGEVEHFDPGQVVQFDPDACGACKLRSDCTLSASGRGRTVKIAEDEQRQQRLRRAQSTRKGREKLRNRTAIEHRLAHVSARKGHRARYNGARKNTYDLRRTAAIQNLETIQRRSEAKSKSA